MSRDADPQQRLWLSLGYGGKTARSDCWRYWKNPDEERTWIIAAPNGLAEFLLVHRAVPDQGREVLLGKTQTPGNRPHPSGERTSKVDEPYPL